MKGGGRGSAQTYVLPELWEQAVSNWLSWLQASGAPAATRRLRRGNVRWVARMSGTACPSEITLALLVRVCSGRQWSNEHRRGMRRTLITFFDWAVDTGCATTNPAVGMPKVPQDKPRPRPCPDSMWRDLMTAPPRERLMIRLAGEVGMRRAEVARCHRDDLIDDRDGWCLLVHGKGGKQRVVPITDRLAADVAAFCARGYLFPGTVVEPGHVGGHLSAMHVGKLISALMPHGWSMHKLRHRYATRGLAGTGDLLAVRDALGHSSVATTQIYTAIATDKVRRVAEAAADNADECTPVS